MIEVCGHELVMGKVIVQAGQSDRGRARGSLALGRWCWAWGSRPVGKDNGLLGIGGEVVDLWPVELD